MWHTEEGSTGRLVQLCFFYFLFYVITGVVVKYFTSGGPELPHVSQMEYLVFSTIGGSALALFVALALRWYRIKSNHLVSIGKIKVPVELFYIIPSGICTAVVVPTTTLMYLLPIPVMAAMVIMRGSVIITSRIIDAIQIKQGILKKKVYWEEEVAVIFAIIAISVDIFFSHDVASGFEFIHSPAALGILSSYIVAYFIRIYIMNYYKNTRGKGIPQDNKGFFAIEQICAATTMVVVGVLLFVNAKPDGIVAINQYYQALTMPTGYWSWEILAGTAFGAVSFFSVFLFMFKGRTATFAGLVNRLTSLVAGTAATLIFCFTCSGKFPSIAEWTSLATILIAVMFLSKAEKKRVTELKATHEIK
jgi:hypothetical protein